MQGNTDVAYCQAASKPVAYRLVLYIAVSVDQRIAVRYYHGLKQYVICNDFTQNHFLLSIMWPACYMRGNTLSCLLLKGITHVFVAILLSTFV